MSNAFWIFGHLGLGDAICCNGLFRFYAEKYSSKEIIIAVWEHNMSSVSWMLSDVKNISFYPTETEQQLLTCRDSIAEQDRLTLGFYKTSDVTDQYDCDSYVPFNPVLWDSEFYRQAGLPPSLKWEGFKLPLNNANLFPTTAIFHEDEERGFRITTSLLPDGCLKLDKSRTLADSAKLIYRATEIHVIDSSMLNLSDLMPTPFCKRFVFHRYARKGLPPTLRKAWEILD